MNLDEETREKFSPLTKVKLGKEDKTDILNNLRKEMSGIEPRRKFSMGGLPQVAAAVAAVVIVGGVGFEMHSSHMLSQNSEGTPTTEGSRITNATGRSSVNSASRTNDTSNHQTPPGSQWQIVGKMYLVQGTITAVSGHSLNLNVRRNVKGADSAVTSPNYPFKVGSAVPIRFGSSLSPKVGDHVVLDVSQYATGGSPFWGVLSPNYYIEQSGSYYNQNGQKLRLPANGATAFSGTSVQLLTGKNTPTAIPNGYKGVQPGLTFSNQRFTPIEGFTGTLNGEKFVLDFYSNKPNGIAVGVMYNNKPVYFGFGPSPMFDVLNFTGDNVVLGSPSAGAYMAINLVSGQVNTNQSEVVSMKGYSGINPPTHVLGLTGKQYPVAIPYGK